MIDRHHRACAVYIHLSRWLMVLSSTTAWAYRTLNLCQGPEQHMRIARYTPSLFVQNVTIVTIHILRKFYFKSYFVISYLIHNKIIIKKIKSNVISSFKLLNFKKNRKKNKMYTCIHIAWFSCTCLWEWRSRRVACPQVVCTWCNLDSRCPLRTSALSLSGSLARCSLVCRTESAFSLLNTH